MGPAVYTSQAFWRIAVSRIGGILAGVVIIVAFACALAPTTHTDAAVAELTKATAELHALCREAWQLHLADRPAVPSFLHPASELVSAALEARNEASGAGSTSAGPPVFVPSADGGPDTTVVGVLQVRPAHRDGNDRFDSSCMHRCSTPRRVWCSELQASRAVAERAARRRTRTRASRRR
jgi:hypothetical protein